MNPTERIRQALQVMKVHPCTVLDVKIALAMVEAMPNWREGGLDRWRARNEALLLKVLNGEEDRGLHRRINERAALAARIASCAENGVVSIHESGMDCDCVTFSGILRHAVPATLYAVNKEMCDAQQWADGPLHLTVISPSEAKGVEYKSRDNVMEAYEDGHPHSVVARMPE